MKLSELKEKISEEKIKPMQSTAKEEKQEQMVPVFVPMQRGKVKGIGFMKEQAGKPVSVATIRPRGKELEAYFYDANGYGQGFADVYTYTAIALACGVLALVFLNINIYLAALFALGFGKYYGEYVWVHYFTVPYPKTRTIMYTA